VTEDSREIDPKFSTGAAVSEAAGFYLFGIIPPLINRTKDRPRMAESSAPQIS